VAVEAFLDGRLPFVAIPQVIDQALRAADHELGAPSTLAEVRAADRWARAFSAAAIGTLPSS
jgi:1-deoxy-D-xylulose-5-phosphate reductoisomerase